MSNAIFAQNVTTLSVPLLEKLLGMNLEEDGPLESRLILADELVKRQDRKIQALSRARSACDDLDAWDEVSVLHRAAVAHRDNLVDTRDAIRSIG